MMGSCDPRCFLDMLTHVPDVPRNALHLSRLVKIISPNPVFKDDANNFQTKLLHQMLDTPADTFPVELDPIPKDFLPEGGAYIGKIHNHSAEVILAANVVTLSERI